MKIVLLVVMVVVLNTVAFPQGFEITGLQDNYNGTIGETIKAPVRIKNTSDKAITVVIRKISSQIGSTQKNYLCIDGNCLDQRVEDYIVKLDAGQSLNTFQIVLDAGLVSGESVVKYQIYNRINPGQPVEFDLNFNVEERPEKENIYSSRFVTLHDVYPNPVVDQAVVDYKILNERIKAKLVVHNLLGNVVGEYSLPSFENLVRVKTDDLAAGIYFYTLYVDDESVMTRKLIVRK
ncbi:T9SS type A sorting domain-containing protein [Chryseolinea sp. T2]|uniref:T9SS type A sorting domain-containing protein n=1 Tax=Chryseolinea sp. T2 TaxID=3129255 RepID=UPI00307721C0